MSAAYVKQPFRAARRRSAGLKACATRTPPVVFRCIRARCAVVALAAALTMAQAAPPKVAVWIDTDPAIGEKERDVDDGLALVQAFRSPELEIRGVSVVFGNAPLASARRRTASGI